MVRTKQTARKSTGGRAPRRPLVPPSEVHTGDFVGNVGMPTVLWRVLHDIGYIEGQQPQYSWDELQYQRNRMAIVRVYVPPLDNAPEWTGWDFETTAATPEDAAERVAMSMIRWLMERYPREVAAAMAGTFSRGDPMDKDWEQPLGNGLVRGPDEIRGSDNNAMTVIFASFKAFDGMLRSFLNSMSMRREEKKRAKKKKNKFMKAIKRLQDQLDCTARERDVALASEQRANRRVQELQHDAEVDGRYIDWMVQDRKNTWKEYRKLEAETQQLGEANKQLREEYYARSHGTQPYVPPTVPLAQSSALSAAPPFPRYGGSVREVGEGSRARSDYPYIILSDDETELMEEDTFADEPFLEDDD